MPEIDLRTWLLPVGKNILPPSMWNSLKLWDMQLPTLFLFAGNGTYFHKQITKTWWVFSCYSPKNIKTILKTNDYHHHNLYCKLSPVGYNQVGWVELWGFRVQILVIKTYSCCCYGKTKRDCNFLTVFHVIFNVRYWISWWDLAVKRRDFRHHMWQMWCMVGAITP